jgi:hypothetical protein
MLFLTLAGCGHPQPTVGFGGPPPAPPSPSQPVTPAPVEQRTVVPDSEVDASKLPEGYPRTVWTQDSGTVLVVSVAHGGCGDDQAEVADQSPRQVTIAVVHLQHRSGMCPQFFQYVPQAVRLATPLDQRKVVLEERATSTPNSGPPTG